MLLLRHAARRLCTRATALPEVSSVAVAAHGRGGRLAVGGEPPAPEPSTAAAEAELRAFWL